ncbi:hypothetical protein B0H19DRAFT_1058556 [Mycena capillaripes]|nr:hypothetical protein B0H19DRAFT_1058556 [Mycena capillaripes]
MYFAASYPRPPRHRRVSPRHRRVRHLLHGVKQDVYVVPQGRSLAVLHYYMPPESVIGACQFQPPRQRRVTAAYIRKSWKKLIDVVKITTSRQLCRRFADHCNALQD